ncbi:MAG: hypothetical protein JJLCMIEE_00353 [Acidimicrobiales bacterium]|nr:MAG: hypothetical protein EDR02_17875 [Actinomycetota bacterium]MBV6507310.1 hypothetical protein [Acidimicrobiales bacterium]RIK02955.1 MAG: hypothetical protein DCC48_17335 [Acidobacteriota bacterium]
MAWAEWLKTSRWCVDSSEVQYERLVIEAGDNTFTVDFHPRLTVIAGVSQMERDGLVSEMIGALSNSRSGVHLELASDAGARFAIFRPNVTKHRVVDVNAAIDVTNQFMDEDGGIDLLGRARLDMRSARRKMVFNATDLHTQTEAGQIVRRLALLDQNELWAAAEAVRSTEAALDDEAESSGSTAEDAEVIERIEARHAEFERAQARHESVRHASFFVGAFSALGAIPATVLVSSMAAMPFVGAAVVTTLISMAYWRKNESARRKEEEALAEAGASSYLGFHLQRVNGLLSSDQARRRLMKAAEEHREAVRRWEILAGEVDVNWAIDHAKEITAAAQVHHDVSSLSTVSSTAPETGNDETAAMSHAVISRLSDLRKLGPGGESFPALLDDPFIELDSSVKPSLLELLVRSSEDQQVIFLTEDEDVTSWARLEAMTGALSILEPSGEVEKVQGPHVAA